MTILKGFNPVDILIKLLYANFATGKTISFESDSYPLEIEANFQDYNCTLVGPSVYEC